MPFSRAVLAACAAVLGFIFYFIAFLFVVLALANWQRAVGTGAPLSTTLALAACFAAAGAVFRVIARRIV